ncbi:MAG: ATP-binding protein [Planctomycetota bacterium]
MDTSVIDQHEALADFIDEGVESLRGLPAQLDAYRSTPTVAEPINAVFRAIHSIKGCAAFLGLDAIRAFSHALENTLDVIRTEFTPLHDVLEHSLIEGFDRLDALLQEAAGGKIATELRSEDMRILEAVRAAASSSPPGQTAEAAFLAAIQRIANLMDAGGLEVRQAGQELRGLLHGYTSQSNLQEPEVLALETMKPAELGGYPEGPQNNLAATDQQAAVAELAEPAAAAKSSFVRVKEEHLNDFLEHVSRMFITSDRFRDLQLRMAQTRQLPELAEELSQINMDLKVESTTLQHGVMTLRRVSIGGLFSKFPRMARGLASQLGKQIHMHLSGEETEIDKQLSEDLDALLTHLVRNVVDHAMETPEQRTACRKSETGNLHLEAQSTPNLVAILVRDDGRGMDPQRLRAKAVEKGIITQTQADALSNEDALQLIFRPGFSTAEQVSEVSGRGVGMDVVRATVEQHHGQVSIESVVGQGTTIRLEFPVRQATLVIDGLMVAGGTDQFVIPFENIKEIVRVDAAQFQSVHGRPMAMIGNSTFHAVHLEELTGMRHEDRMATGSEVVVVVECKGRSLCIRVDNVLGHRQVVVTALNKILPDSTKLTGIAQLGGGRLAPVLNIPEIVKNLV